MIGDGEFLGTGRGAKVGCCCYPVKEPLMAVGIAVLWGPYGAFYFIRNSKKMGRDTMAVKPA